MQAHHWLTLLLIAAVFFFLGARYPAPVKAIGLA